MFAIRLKGKKTSTQNKKGPEEIMSQDNGLKDKVKGGMNKMKGEAKDKAGDMANKSDLKAEGKKDKAKGSLQKGVGKTKDKLSDD
ncbi:Stress response protein csbD [Bacillus velezensis]